MLVYLVVRDIDRARTRKAKRICDYVYVSWVTSDCCQATYSYLNNTEYVHDSPDSLQLHLIDCFCVWRIKVLSNSQRSFRVAEAYLSAMWG